MNEKLLQLLEGREIYYPHALEQHFPQMLIKIVELWNSPEFDSYLQQLMLDQRDHQRQGFPTEVATDILRLSRINSEQRERTQSKTE